ncbi:MAG: argininosuccinate synthase [Gaiellaceae bacterium]|jgi:argininosuccinate synthase
MSRTAVLCYSGGLDTTCAICWLKEDYGFADVVAVLVDVGQEFDLEQAIERGNVAGAKEIVVLDLKERFAAGIVAQAIKTNALYEGRYPLVSALSRSLIAGAVAEVAVEHQAEALVHGCTGKGNDQLRFDFAFKANYPGVKVIAPLRDKVRTREEEIVYAQERGIPITNTKESPYSIDENLFGRAIESGLLEDPWNAPPEDAYRMTSDPAKAPAPKEIVIGFEAGIPVSLDGEKLPLYTLIHRLNVEAGAYGIGRIDMIENRSVGIKSREVYEAPAAIALIEAHKALDDLVLTRDELRLKHYLEVRWTELVYEGKWFAPAREAIDSFVDHTQKLVAGEVSLRLQGGQAVVVGRRSLNALYAETLASYGASDTFPHEAAEGLITLLSLETEAVAARARKNT